MTRVWFDLYCQVFDQTRASDTTFAMFKRCITLLIEGNRKRSK